MKTRTIIQIGWVVTWYFSDVKDSWEMYLFWKQKWYLWEKESGLEWTVKRFKLIRLCVTRYLSGHPYFPSGVDIGMTKDGLPRALGPLKKMIRGQKPRDVRFVLTLLSAGRAIRPTTVKIEDSTSITNPSTRDLSVVNDIAMFCNAFAFRTLNVNPISTSFKSLHFTEKAGPNGNGVLSSLTDYKALDPALRASLIALGGDKIKEVFDDLDAMHPVAFTALSSYWSKPREAVLRRISLKADRELKVRPFCILDYWSQTVLKPIHDGVFDILRTRFKKCDFTFDHNASLEYVRSLNPDGKKKFYSFDLSSATDRFPMDLQVMIMEFLVGNTKAQHWKSILIDRDFQCPGSSALSYKAGQPLGAYSSWAVFTLCHHMVVRYAAMDPQFSNYAIIGDDIVIVDCKVAARYKEVISSLGVSISEAKSHVSHDMFEIAKKWYYRGEEVTPFPVDGLASVWEHYDLLALFLIEQQKTKGLVPSGGLANSFMIRDLWSRFGKPRRWVKSCSNGYRRFVLFPWSGDNAGDHKSAKAFIMSLGLQVSCSISEQKMRLLLSEIAAQKVAFKIRDRIIEAHKAHVGLLNRSQWLIVAPGYGPFEDREDGALKAFPFFGSQLAVIQDLHELLAELRARAGTGRYEEILMDKPVLFLSDPAAKLSGDREVELLGTRAAVVHNTIKGVKELWQSISTELSSQDNSSCP